MYCGRRFYVSCRQLGTAETKEASVQAANRWWSAKQSDLDLAHRAGLTPPRVPLPGEDVAAALIGSKAWDSVQAIVDAAAHYLSTLPNSPEAETLAETLNDAAYMEGEAGDESGWEHVAADLRDRLLSSLLTKAILEGQPLPAALRERLPPARAHQIESALKGLRGESAADPDRTVQAQVDVWDRKQQAMVSIGGMTAARANNALCCLRHFAAFVGESVDVACIDAERLEGFHNFCLSKIAERRQDSKAGWAAAYAREVFAVARAFIRGLVERGLIPPPANLASRGFRFGSILKNIEVWTAEEVRDVIGAATGKLKLCLLLCLNCGMTQADVSDLRDAEVNWRDGRVVRKRSKTRGHDSAPTVNYPLWRCTFALLKQHRSGTDRVLLTKSGQAFVRKRQSAEGKLTGGDNFAANFKWLQKRIGFNKPMKLLRKTGASMLETHATYGRFTSLFLGHAPATMAQGHYAAPPQELFDAAVLWLGEQFEVDKIAM
jgi:integrase